MTQLLDALAPGEDDGRHQVREEGGLLAQDFDGAAMWHLHNHARDGVLQDGLHGPADPRCRNADHDELVNHEPQPVGDRLSASSPAAD